jgi:hypothetical protein
MNTNGRSKPPKRPTKDQIKEDKAKPEAERTFTDQYMKMFVNEATSNTKGQKAIGGMDDAGMAKYMGYIDYFQEQQNSRQADIDTKEAKMLDLLKAKHNISCVDYETEQRFRKKKRRELEPEQDVLAPEPPKPVINLFSDDESDA